MPGLCGIWTPTLQLALFQCVQLVTHSVWDMLDYQREGRSAGIPAAEVDNYGPGYNPRPRDMNLPYLDVEEALRLLRLLTHSISAQGDKLHRFFTRDICLDAKFWLDPKFGPGVHAPSQWACPVNEIIRSIRPPAPSLHLLPLTFRIRVGEFAGVDMPDKWHIEDLSVSLEDIQCFRVSPCFSTHDSTSFSILKCVDLPSSPCRWCQRK